MRVVLPDRPGQLGAVASALGANGADIISVQIVGRIGHDAVIDDFVIDIPPGRLPDQLISACQALDGVRVDWISRYPEGASLESDLEALELMTSDPEHGAESLTTSAVGVFRVHWAFLVERFSVAPVITFSTPQAPDLTTEQLRGLGPTASVRHLTPAPEWLPGWGEIVLAMAPVRGDRVIVAGRQGGPQFLASELARFGHLAALAQ